MYLGEVFYDYCPAGYLQGVFSLVYLFGFLFIFIFISCCVFCLRLSFVIAEGTNLHQKAVDDELRRVRLSTVAKKPPGERSASFPPPPSLKSTSAVIEHDFQGPVVFLFGHLALPRASHDLVLWFLSVTHGFFLHEFDWHQKFSHCIVFPFSTSDFSGGCGFGKLPPILGRKEVLRRKSVEVGCGCCNGGVSIFV